MTREGYDLRANSVAWNRVTRRGARDRHGPHRQPGRRRRLWRQCRARGHAARRRGRKPAARPRRRRPARGAARRSAGRHHHPLSRRLHALRRGRREGAPRTRPGRSTRSRSSTIRSGTGSPIRAPPSTCSGCRSSPCPGFPTRTAARAAAAACWCPRSATAAATASSSAPLIISASRPSDPTITPHVYTDVLPMLEAEYRQLTWLGAFQVPGYLTYGSRLPIDPPAGTPARRRHPRLFEGNGRLHPEPGWSVTALGPLRDRPHLPAPLRHFARRPAALVRRRRADRRRQLHLDRRLGVRGPPGHRRRRQQPIALPAIDARWRFDDPVLGGRIELQVNSLAILRTEGQDTQRAFASALWERRGITRSARSWC